MNKNAAIQGIAALIMAGILFIAILAADDLISAAQANTMKIYSPNGTVQWSILDENSTHVGINVDVTNSTAYPQTLYVNGSSNFTGEVYYDNSEVCTAGNGLCAGATGADWLVDLSNIPGACPAGTAYVQLSGTGTCSYFAKNGTCSSGYVIQNVTPTGVECVQDQTGSGNNITAIGFNGTTTKTLQVNLSDGTRLNASFTDIDTDTDTNTWWPLNNSGYIINDSNTLNLNNTALNNSIDARTANISASSDGNNYTTGISFNGTSTKTLQLSRSGMSNLSASFTTNLDEVGNPTTDKTFTMGSSGITWLFTNPTGSPFTIEASGAYSGNLVHLHQTTGNPGAGYLLQLIAEDTDVEGIEINISNPHALEIYGNSHIYFVGNGSVQSNNWTNVSIIYTQIRDRPTDLNNFTNTAGYIKNYTDTNITAIAFSGTTTKTLQINDTAGRRFNASFTDIDTDTNTINNVTAIGVTGTTTKTLQLNQSYGVTVLNTTWTDIDTDTNTISNITAIGFSGTTTKTLQVNTTHGTYTVWNASFTDIDTDTNETHNISNTDSWLNVTNSTGTINWNLTKGTPLTNNTYTSTACSGTDQVTNVTLSNGNLSVVCTAQGSGGGMTSWTLSNGSSTETISDSERVNITGGTGIVITQGGSQLVVNSTVVDTDTNTINNVTAIGVTGTTTKTLQLNQSYGVTVLNASWTDIDTDTNSWWPLRYPFMENVSSVLDVNRTHLNLTIDTRVSNLTDRNNYTSNVLFTGNLLTTTITGMNNINTTIPNNAITLACQNITGATSNLCTITDTDTNTISNLTAIGFSGTTTKTLQVNTTHGTYTVWNASFTDIDTDTNTINNVTAIGVTGTTTKTLQLNQSYGVTVLNTTWTDIDTDTNTISNITAIGFSGTTTKTLQVNTTHGTNTVWNASFTDADTTYTGGNSIVLTASSFGINATGYIGYNSSCSIIFYNTTGGAVLALCN